MFHLTGQARVAEVFFSTYDIDRHSSLSVSSFANTERVPKSEDAQVIVESIYDVLPGVRQDEPSTIENSPGWDVLLASKVCLMHRDPTRQDDPSSAQSTEKAMGVGIIHRDRLIGSIIDTTIPLFNSGSISPCQQLKPLSTPVIKKRGHRQGTCRVS